MGERPGSAVIDDVTREVSFEARGSKVGATPSRS
jgi:hypothetical protein